MEGEIMVLVQLTNRMSMLETGIYIVAEELNRLSNLVSNNSYGKHRYYIARPTNNGKYVKLDRSIIIRQLIPLVQHLTIDINDYIQLYDNDSTGIRNNIPEDISANDWRNAAILYNLIYNRANAIIKEEQNEVPELNKNYSKINKAEITRLLRLLEDQLKEDGIFINRAYNHWLARYFIKNLL
ncbi:unnamed protein product [Cunninghamella echinulata]